MTLAGLCITPETHGEWLAERGNSLGASEAAAAIGVSPWESPLALYLKKAGLAEPIIETPAMRWGTRLEPLIAEAYAEATGCGFAAEQRFVRHPEIPFITATLDRVRDDGRIVELKTVGARGAADWGNEGSDEVPTHYLVQVLHQLAITGGDIADVAVLIAGQDFRVYTVERDDRVIARILEGEAEFWGHVERREPPEPDPDRDGRCLARLWPDAAGEVEFDATGQLLVDDYEEHGRRIKAHQEARERCRTEILTRMRDAACARLLDGRMLTRKVVRVKEQQITRRGYEYVDLRLRKGD